VNESLALGGERRTAGPPARDISVIIPTCDRPELLSEAIASVLSQTLPPREILIIDNGLTPVSEADLPQVVRVYRIAPRAGPSRARNFGAAIARGKHLAFLDDDDWWDRDFLLEARTVMASEKVRCVYGRKMACLEGALTPYKLASPNELTVFTLLRRNPGTGGMNLLIERRLYLSIGGFDDRLSLSEDRALALEVVLSGDRIATAPKAIAVVRHHNGGRLRQRHLRKLSFVWKYRRHYSPIQFSLATGRILLRSMAAKFLPHRHK
jgi:glycosyltransferase involved in cell wall biosynthesis